MLIKALSVAVLVGFLAPDEAILSGGEWTFQDSPVKVHWRLGLNTHLTLCQSLFNTFGLMLDLLRVILVKMAKKHGSYSIYTTSTEP